jgi:hypothetical protein
MKRGPIESAMDEWPSLCGDLNFRVGQPFTFL